MDRARRLAAVGNVAAAWMISVLGAAASAQPTATEATPVGAPLIGLPPIELLAIAGTGGRVLGADMAGEELASIEHASASPGGCLVLVGRTNGPLGASQHRVWVRGMDGSWSLRVVAYQTAVPALVGSRIAGLIAPPIVDDLGRVTVLANLTAESGVYPPNSSLGVVCLRGEGEAPILKLRLHALSGPGVPAMGMIHYGGEHSDSVRASTVGSIYSNRLGLFTDQHFTTAMRPLTLASHRNIAPPGAGSAMIVTTLEEGAMASSGRAVQRISTGSYQREDLAGLVMFSPLGVPSFAVHDGSTPIEGLADQFVLSTTFISPGAGNLVSMVATRVGINSDGAIAFVGRFGPRPAPGPLGAPTPPLPQSTPIGLFVKAPGHAARLIAQLNAAAIPATAGVPEWRFMSFGTPIINGQGDTLFAAAIQAPTTAGAPWAGVIRQSIWVCPARGEARVVAVAGAEAGGPGAPPAAIGGVFAQFTSAPTINRRGQVVFQAQHGSGASTATLFAYDPIGGLAVLARNGQAIAGVGGDPAAMTLATHTDIGGLPVAGSGNDDALATRLTDDGVVIFRAFLAPGGAAVLSVSVPTARGACCMGSTCLVQARLDCVGVAHRFVGENSVCVGAWIGAASSCCAADFDQSGDVSSQDLFGFVAAWIGREMAADADRSGVIGIEDVTRYVGEYLAGCG